MAVTLNKLTSVACVLILACASACTCPQGGSGRGRSIGGQSDPSGGSLAFFGGMRSFFSEAPADESNGRSCTDADLSDSDATTTSASVAGARAGTATLSIR